MTDDARVSDEEQPRNVSTQTSNGTTLYSTDIKINNRSHRSDGDFFSDRTEVAIAGIDCTSVVNRKWVYSSFTLHRSIHHPPCRIALIRALRRCPCCKTENVFYRQRDLVRTYVCLVGEEKMCDVIVLNVLFFSHIHTCKCVHIHISRARTE